MDTTMIKTQAIKFSRGRTNLMVLIGFTVINLFLIAFDFNLNFLFSAFVPQLLLVFGLEFSGMGVGMFIALIPVAIYLACFILSKKYRFFILIALILFIMDSLVMLGTMAWLGNASDFIFNILFHIWILFYLITGTAAWIKLRKVTPEEFEAIQQTVAREAKQKELNSAMETVVPPPASEEDASKESDPKAEEQESSHPYHNPYKTDEDKD